MAYSRVGLGQVGVGEAFTGVVSVDSGGRVLFRYPGISGPVCGPTDVLQELVDEYRRGGAFPAVLWGKRTSKAVGPRWCEWTIHSWEFAPEEGPVSDTAVGTSPTETAGEFLVKTSGTDVAPEAVPTTPDPRTTEEGATTEIRLAPQEPGGEPEVYTTEPMGTATEPESVRTAGPGPEMLGWLLLGLVGVVASNVLGGRA